MTDGAKILISESCLSNLPNGLDYKFRMLEEVRVKGKKESLFIFEIYKINQREEVNSEKERN